MKIGVFYSMMLLKSIKISLMVFFALEMALCLDINHFKNDEA